MDNVLFYVDNIIVIRNNTIYIQALKKSLINTFEMRDFREAKLYLEVKLKYTIEGIYFYWKNYLQNIVVP